MNKILVEGGKRLVGEVEIGGSKNAALPVLLGGIVTGGSCVFSNLPRVSDVLRALEILKVLGARICFLAGGEVRIDYGTVGDRLPPAELCGNIRGSTYLLGAMLARFGRAVLPRSGGCDFGARPIDQHLLGFSELGATVSERADGVEIVAKALRGKRIRLAMPSVGATANLMLAATAATGETVIENAAAEPHVAALADFLQTAGAEIRGVGTGCITVVGARPLGGVRWRVIPDMIEAGTYLCLGAACGGPVRVSSVVPQQLEAQLSAFSQMGIEVKKGDDWISASAPNGYDNIALETGPYPALPTDLHPQSVALLALGRGVGRMTERVFADRFRYLEGLRRMGADVRVSGRTATVHPTPLHAERLIATDLRGGAALLIAALATKGKSEILNADQLGRGYEHLEQKLRALGACVSIN